MSEARANGSTEPEELSTDHLPEWVRPDFEVSHLRLAEASQSGAGMADGMVYAS